MTYGENKKLTLALIEEYAPDLVKKTEDDDIALRLPFLYQLAYQEFIGEHKFSVVTNCFLMPTEENDTVDKESVSLQMLSKLGLESIKVRFLPATIANESYLSGRKIDLSILKL